MDLDTLLAEPEVSRTLHALVEACRVAQDNTLADLDPEHGARRGDYGYVGHSYRRHEVERLLPEEVPGFRCQTSEQRIEVARDDLRIMVAGLGKRPSRDPGSWMPHNQDGWPPTEQAQGDLLTPDGVPLCGNVVFVCCLLGTDGSLESVELRIPRIDQDGFLFAWEDIKELWSVDRDARDDEHEEEVDVELRRPLRKEKKQNAHSSKGEKKTRS